VTGGEPTLHLDLPLLIREIRRHGFLVKLDTNGSNPFMLERLVDMKGLDFVSMDVKAPLNLFSTDGPQAFPSTSSPSKVDRPPQAGGVEFEFRMTVVPGLHREEDIRDLGHQLRAGRRFVLQNFNPDNPLDPSLKTTRPMI